MVIILFLFYLLIFLVMLPEFKWFFPLKNVQNGYFKIEFSSNFNICAMFILNLSKCKPWATAEAYVLKSWLQSETMGM